MSEVMSRSAFARDVPCDEKQVRRWIGDGLLPQELTAADVETARALKTARSRSRGARTPARTSGGVRASDTASSDIAVRDDETPEEAAERIVREGGLLDLPDALKLKENYLGRLKQLEYDQKAGLVVLAADVARVHGAACARIRTRLLAIPSEQAPRVHRLRTVVEVEDMLREIITAALEELTSDAAGRTG